MINALGVKSTIKTDHRTSNLGEWQVVRGEEECENRQEVKIFEAGL